MKGFIYAVFLLCLATSSCISDFNGILPVSSRLPVLNGVLIGDSAIKVNLTWSNVPDSNSFSPIQSAVLFLKDEEGAISHPIQSNEDGTYLFTDSAMHGHSYEIEVEINEGATLKASTIIPPKMQVVCSKIPAQNQMSQPEFQLTINELPEEVHALYVFWHSAYGADSIWQQNAIYCSSAFTDPFNRTYDSWGPNGYTYEYLDFIRFPAANLPTRSLETTIAAYASHSFTRIYVLAATKTYDLYYKGGYLQRSFDPEVNFPLSYQPIFLPSNVDGGAGIFAGLAIYTFEFNLLPN